MILIFIVCIILGIFVYLYTKKENEKVEHYKDLYQYSNQHAIYGTNVTDASTLKSVFADEGVKAKAEAAKKAHDERIKRNKAEEHRDIVIKRSYSYKYEDFIYGLFAPYRIEKGYWTHIKEKWYVIEKLEIDFVIDEISNYFHINKDKATSLYKEFVQNWLLFDGIGRKKCSLGSIFERYWNEISEYDNNYSSWIESHNEIESKESSLRRRAPYNITKATPLSEFEKTNRICRLDYEWSNYILVCDYTKIFVNLKSIGYHGEENKYSIEKYIIENKENLIVFEDDDIFNLYEKNIFYSKS